MHGATIRFIKFLLQNQIVCLNIDISVGTHQTVEVQIPAGIYIFVLSTKSGPAVKPALTTSQGISWASFPGVSGWGVDLTRDVLLILKFGNHAATPPRHHTFL